MPAPTPAKAPKWRRTWLSPTGLSAIAAIAAVIVGVFGLLAQNREQGGPMASPAVPSGAVPGDPALFVYGSSMPGMSRYDAISRYVVRSARDTVQGSLYDSGLGYPLARFGGDRQIRGVVLWLDPATAEAALTEMTRVEAGLFHPVTVRTVSGVSAQAYQWIGSTDGFPRIEAWDGSTAHYGARLGWPELTPGDCFQPFDDSTMTTMWCEAPHAFEVYHTGTAQQGAGDVRMQAEKACEVAFTGFIGRKPSASDLTTRVFSESAQENSRARFLCAVGVPGQVHAGSLKGSDR